MARPRKLWYRTARQTVHVEIDGEHYPLARDPDNDETWERAWLAYHQLMAEILANPPIDAGDQTVASIVDEFLDYSVKRDAPSRFYERNLYLHNFCTHLGPRLARNCKPFYLSKWVDNRLTWGSNWTVKMKLLDENPFAGVTWPKCDGQRRPMTTEEYETLLKAVGKTSRLGEILRFLWNTGCRPSGLRHLRWQDIHLEVPHPAIVLAEHKTSRTQRTLKPRVIPLVREVAELLQEIEARQEHDEFTSSYQACASRSFTLFSKYRRVMLPARQAYSHSASVGNRYVFRSFLASHRQKATASFQHNCVTGCRSSPVGMDRVKKRFLTPFRARRIRRPMLRQENDYHWKRFMNSPTESAITSARSANR